MLQIVGLNQAWTDMQPVVILMIAMCPHRLDCNCRRLMTRWRAMLGSTTADLASDCQTEDAHAKHASGCLACEERAAGMEHRGHS